MGVAVESHAELAPSTDELDALDATALAAAVAAGEVSSEELTRRSLERIERLDGRLNAFVCVLAEEALRDARRKDRQRRPGSGTRPPFHGVPIGIKDLNFVRGAATRLGSRAGPRFRSPFDDRTVRRLRAAGFVVLGKTATSELGVMPVVETDLHPPTRNPYDLSRSAGGSSGGSSAAIASGMLPIAHGSDGGGSVRIPAAFCGLFGHKPSRGLLANAYGLPTADTLYTCGAIGRSARDVRAMVEAMRPGSARPFEAATLRGRRLRIHRVLQGPQAPADPESAEAVHTVSGILEAVGHDVREVEMFPGELEDFLPLYKKMLSELVCLRTSRLQPVTAWLRSGEQLSRGALRRRLRELSGAIAEWLAPADLLLTPTVGGPAPRSLQWEGLGPEETFRAAARLGAYTAPFNISGMPAATLPVGRSREGLPLGVQIVGAHGADALVLEALEVVSRQTGPLSPVVSIDPLLDAGTGIEQSRRRISGSRPATMIARGST